LPWVFVVDRNGRIAWWGQPFYAAFDGALDAVLAGKWDAKRERTWRAGRQADDRRGWRLRQDATEAGDKEDGGSGRTPRRPVTRRIGHAHGRTLTRSSPWIRSDGGGRPSSA